MIDIRNLSKWYGTTTAIKNLNFKVNKGEVVGFLGPNGAGKSTTMKIVTGYMAPSHGEVKVGDYDVFEHPIEVKKKIGYLPETPPLHMDMYVRDYLAYVAKLKDVPSKNVKSHVDASLEKAGLTEVRDRLIQNLSKGYKQRVGIAQALVSNPELLILDEPTVGLDPKQVAEIRALIQRLKGHHTIVLSTHILPEVQATCERIIIINKGQIVAEDSLEGLKDRMHTSKRISVKVRRPDSKLEQHLKNITGVTAVKLNGTTFEIDTDGKEDRPENISAVIVQAGAGLIEMRGKDMNLEEIFLKLTEEEKQGGV
ncbi:MAG: ABC transporter ATP-binding protein [Bdellovibrionales bacterium]